MPENDLTRKQALLLARLMNDQWNAPGEGHDGMFGQTRPAGDRTEYQPDKKEPQNRPQAFMTFNAVRTLQILRPPGWEGQVARAGAWAERLLAPGHLAEVIDPDTRYSVGDGVSNMGKAEYVVFRHTFGLACILFATGKRLDLASHIVNLALQPGVQQADGGWPLREGPEKREHLKDLFTSLWALILLRLASASAPDGGLKGRVDEAVERTIAHMVITNVGGLWGTGPSNNSFMQTCDVIPDMSLFFKHHSPAVLRSCVTALASEFDEDGWFKNSFTESRDATDVFQLGVRAAFAIGSAMEDDNVLAHEVYKRLVTRLLVEEYDQIPLNTYDICRLLFLVRQDLPAERKSESALFGFDVFRLLRDSISLKKIGLGPLQLDPKPAIEAIGNRIRKRKQLS